MKYPFSQKRKKVALLEACFLRKFSLFETRGNKDTKGSFHFPELPGQIKQFGNEMRHFEGISKSMLTDSYHSAAMLSLGE